MSFHEPDSFGEFISDEVFGKLYGICQRNQGRPFSDFAWDYVEQQLPKDWSKGVKEDSKNVFRYWPAWKAKITTVQIEKLFSTFGFSVINVKELLHGTPDTDVSAWSGTFSFPHPTYWRIIQRRTAMRTTKELAQKSVAASLLIALGDYVLLKIGMPIGPFLFAFGLLGVCVLSLNLFTGKCGFWFSDKLRLHDLMKILGINLISGYLFGLCMHVMDTDVAAAAAARIPAYTISFPFFLKSVFCGTIMYLAVKMYREKNLFGIFFGVPLFIFCGFQHCIANIITIGASGTISPYLIGCMLLCIAGNFAGSLAAAYLCEPRH